MQENIMVYADNSLKLALRLVYAEQVTDQHQLSASRFLLFIRSFRKIAKIDYLLHHVCLSFCPRLPPDGFLKKFTFEYFSKLRREFSSFIKIWQE